MKYICYIFTFLVIISYSYTAGNNKSTNAYALPDLSFLKKNNNYKSQVLNINDTFSMNGTLISTIIPKISHDNVTNSKIQLNKTTNNNQSDNTNPSFLSNQLSSLKSNLTIKDNRSKQSDTLSDNLVAMLSGIIVQSIENGNPTINNIKNDTVLTVTNNYTSNNTPIIISGKWTLDVSKGNVTNFNTKFVMINSDATGFHWHLMNNFKSNEKLFLGNDDSAILNGSLDFYTGGNSTAKKVNVLLTINNLELIEMVLLDNSAANHFYGFPLYGVIDSIKIKN